MPAQNPNKPNAGCRLGLFPDSVSYCSNLDPN